MEFNRYLELLGADLSRIESLASQRLAASVPSCPGWLVRDVVTHLAVVYLHKIECIRNLAPPDPWPPDVDEDDPVGLLRSAYNTLRAELRDRGPQAPAYSWHPSDQTVGFWYRRMALETVVHRLDVELALGAVTPVPADLAADGIDEVLMLMLAGDWSDEPVSSAPYRVDLTTGDAAWVIRLEPSRITCEPKTSERPADDAIPALSLAGPSPELFSWLWGRGDLPTTTVSGDASLVPRLRERLVLATQ